MKDSNTSSNAKRAKLSHDESSTENKQEVGKHFQKQVLCEDALAQVLHYLHPRDLLRMSETSKALREYFTIAIIVTSAMIHGGHGATTIKELYKLMKDCSIHIPSPMRLLRLINGKRCEICFHNKVNHVRPKTGVFACWICLTGEESSVFASNHTLHAFPRQQQPLTRSHRTSLAKYRKNKKYEAIFSHPRVACNSYTKETYTWNRKRAALPTTGDDDTEEWIGPLVCYNDIDRMANESDRGIDTYITEELGAPQKEAYNEFVSVYEETEARAKRETQLRLEEKKAKKQKTIDNKLAKIKKMVLDLQAILDDRWSEFATSHKILPSWKMNRPGKYPIVEFHIGFVNDTLKPYVISPSKLKKKVLKDIANQINENFGYIFESDFMSFHFLSDDGVEGLLKQMCMEHISSLELWREQKLFSLEIFELLKQEQYFQCICMIERKYWSKLKFSSLLYYDIEKGLQKRYDLNTLAKRVWDEEVTSTQINTLENLQTTVDICKEKVRNLMTVLEEYLVWKQQKQDDMDDGHDINVSLGICRYSFVDLLNKDFVSVYRQETEGWGNLV